MITKWIPTDRTSQRYTVMPKAMARTLLELQSNKLR